MRYLSVAQMREADRRCIEEIGIPGSVLMNNAGMAVFQYVTAGPVGIVCGRGNNGGDGFVVARLALLAQRKPRVLLVGKRDEVSGDAAVFMRSYENLNGLIEEVSDPSEAVKALHAMENSGVLVDALLGTGTRGEVRGAVRAAIEAWPRCYTISVDVPSGMDADTGVPCGVCVRADVTVTLAFAKTGFAAKDAQPYLGKLVVADIGIPECCGDDVAWASVRSRINERKRHHGNPFGR